MFKKDPVQIIAFKTYGTGSRVYLRGRAIEDESIDLEQKSVLKLLINAWKRFETDEIKHAELVVKLGVDSLFYTKTDERGYFLLDETVDDICKYQDDEGWVRFEFSFKNKLVKREIQFENKFSAHMLIPSGSTRFGVISDIDDTILHTGIVSMFKWRVLFNTFLKSAGKRLPLEGAAEFYKLLHKGKAGHEANPIFYVSHSPWNLYRYLDYFLKQNKFPAGPIILRKFPSVFKRKSKDEKPEKQREIINLLKSYPDLKFILIGDCGEHDPDIYIEITQVFPDRISAIYLRSVKHKKKMLRVSGLFKDYKTTPVLLVETSEQAIEHARKSGFVL
ncbi:App1 family protein [Algibacter sp. L1A34]|uniref:App1 family protein n=1 Tax=Algibacter sp. L1A34 TaxID=2686365 RepID=UPI00131DE930|nr:phosphatase domain-containing protein [Algibacter sp. L1A34]